MTGAREIVALPDWAGAAANRIPVPGTTGDAANNNDDAVSVNKTTVGGVENWKNGMVGLLFVRWEQSGESFERSVSFILLLTITFEGSVTTSRSWIALAVLSALW